MLARTYRIRRGGVESGVEKPIDAPARQPINAPVLKRPREDIFGDRPPVMNRPEPKKAKGVMGFIKKYPKLTAATVTAAACIAAPEACGAAVKTGMAMAKAAAPAISGAATTFAARKLEEKAGDKAIQMLGVKEDSAQASAIRATLESRTDAFLERRRLAREMKGKSPEEQARIKETIQASMPEMPADLREPIPEEYKRRRGRMTTQEFREEVDRRRDEAARRKPLRTGTGTSLPQEAAPRRRRFTLRRSRGRKSRSS